MNTETAQEQTPNLIDYLVNSEDFSDMSISALAALPEIASRLKARLLANPPQSCQLGKQTVLRLADQTEVVVGEVIKTDLSDDNYQIPITSSVRRQMRGEDMSDNVSFNM